MVIIIIIIIIPILQRGAEDHPVINSFNKHLSDTCHVTGVMVLEIHWWTEQTGILPSWGLETDTSGPLNMPAPRCWVPTPFSNQRNQGSLERRLVLGTGQELHKVTWSSLQHQSVKKCPQNKVVEMHASCPGRAHSGQVIILSNLYRCSTLREERWFRFLRLP